MIDAHAAILEHLKERLSRPGFHQHNRHNYLFLTSLFSKHHLHVDVICDPDGIRINVALVETVYTARPEYSRVFPYEHPGALEFVEAYVDQIISELA